MELQVHKDNRVLREISVQQGQLVLMEHKVHREKLDLRVRRGMLGRKALLG